MAEIKLRCTADDTDTDADAESDDELDLILKYASSQINEAKRLFYF